MRLESQSLKRLLIVVLFLLPASLMWLSCGGSSSSSASKTSGLAYRAFISNNVTSGSVRSLVCISSMLSTIRVGP